MPFGTVRDVELYYEVVGSGPRLLFINGTSGDLRRRPPYLDELGEHFTVLRYDQRGLGQSAKPDNRYSMAGYAEDAAALMDVIGWVRAAVLGVSFGGAVAQELAHCHPERITRMALACSTPGGQFGYPLLPLHDKGPETRARTMLGLDLRTAPDWQAAHPEETAALLEQALRRAGRVDFDEPDAAVGARRQLEARDEHNSLDWLGEITQPVGLFGGRHDGLATVAAQHVMAERMPRSELHLFEGAHAFLSENPHALPAVVEFLSREG